MGDTRTCKVFSVASGTPPGLPTCQGVLEIRIGVSPKHLLSLGSIEGGEEDSQDLWLGLRTEFSRADCSGGHALCIYPSAFRFPAATSTPYSKQTSESESECLGQAEGLDSQWRSEPIMLSRAEHVPVNL